jgi:hypothetical protein
MLAFALALGMAVFGCDNGTTGNGNGNGPGGTLTVNNCPSSGSVVICDSNEPTTRLELSGLITGYIAVGQADSATSYRLIKNNGTEFNSSGSFLVILSVGMNNYFKKISFSNGSGSVDFNSMTSQMTLPAM